MSCELDPTKSFNTDLDPKKTLDYALFGRVVFQLNPAVTHTSMKKLIEELDLLRADDEEKKRPPLEIIIYKDLVPEGWTWERLLPCTGGSVLFEDYFNYLEEYFRQNVADESASLNLHAAATNCILAEEQLTNTLASHAGKVTWDPSLGRKIIDQARQIIASDSVTGSIGAIVPAACFLCITEEAKLMSSLADCIFSAVDPTNEFWQRKFKFCEEVRKAALDILTTYKGPYSRRVAAYLLGMTKEASIVFGLLSGTDVYREEKMHVCEDIRPGLLDLLNVILQHFPCESSINYYPIDRDYPAIRSEHKGLHELEPSKQITSVDGSFPVNSGNLIGAPITSKSSPGTPFSCDDVFVKDTTPNRKRKFIEQTQGSGTPSMQSSEPANDIGIEDLFDSQITTNNSATTTPLSHYSSSASGEKSSKDIEINKRRSIGGTKDSGTPSTFSPVPWKDDGMINQLASQITSDGVSPPFTPIKDKFSGSANSIMPATDLFAAESDAAKENSEDEKQ